METWRNGCFVDLRGPIFVFYHVLPFLLQQEERGKFVCQSYRSAKKDTHPAPSDNFTARYGYKQKTGRDEGSEDGPSEKIVSPSKLGIDIC